MARHCLLVEILVISSFVATLGQPARPLFVKFSGCSQNHFLPKTSTLDYRQHLLRTLMQAFRLRNPDDALGGPQVMAACTQAAALLDTYRTLRRAYLNFYREQDSDAGMSEDSAAWMSGRFSLMLEEDPAIGKDRELQKCLKWCIDSTLVLQQMLSQRAITEIHESSVPPGNALNNLLDVSESGCDSFSSRITQYLLARCRDESKERLAQIHVWAALSMAFSEHFFKEQLTCAVRAQGNSEKALSLVRAALSLSWERTSLPQILKSHLLLLQAVKSIEDSRLLTDPDKERIAKNCGNIGPPHMKEFSPLFEEPKTYEEALISMYTLPLSQGNDSRSGDDSNVNRQQRSELEELDSSNVHGDPNSETPKEGQTRATQQDENTYPRSSPPPPPPRVYREGQPEQAVDEYRPHKIVQKTAVNVPTRQKELSEPQGTDLSTSGERAEDSQHQNTDAQELATRSESNETQEMSPVPPPSTSEQPVAHSHTSDSVEKMQLSHTVPAPLAATTPEEHASSKSIQPRGSGTQGKGVAKPLDTPAPLAATTPEEHASSKSIQPRGSGTQGKGVAKPLDTPAPLAATTPEEHASSKSIQPRGSGTQGEGVAKPLDTPDRHGTGGLSKAPLEENKSNASSSAPPPLPGRIKFGSARNRSPTEHESGDKPELRRVASDDYRARRQALPRRKEGSLYSHRLLWSPEQSPASTGTLRKRDDS